MDIISRALQQLHDNELRLSRAQISAGSTSHQYITNVLKNRRYRDPDFPWIIDTILSSSYIRGTKPYPLDDIDMLVILDGSGLYEYKWGMMTAAEIRGQEFGSPVHNLCNEYGFISSKRLLDRFRKAIAETYPLSKVRKDGQAINIQLSSGIGLDVVPCFEIFPADGSCEYLYIPGGPKSEWIITNPRIDREISDALHAYHNDLLRPAVRLAKLWNDEQNAGRLKSYHVEVLVWRAFAALPVMNLRDGLTRFFVTAPNTVLSPCSDPTGLGDLIDGYLSSAARWESHQRLEAAKSELLHSPLPGAWNFVAWSRIFNRPLELMAA